MRQKHRSPAAQACCTTAASKRKCGWTQTSGKVKNWNKDGLLAKSSQLGYNKQHSIKTSEDVGWG